VRKSRPARCTSRSSCLTLARAALLVLVLFTASSVSMSTGTGAMGGGDHATAPLASHHCDGDTMDPATPSHDKDHGSGCPCCFHGSCSCLSSGGAILADVSSMRAVAPAQSPFVRERHAWSAPPIERHLRPPIV
jgi:hypothetical protein